MASRRLPRTILEILSALRNAFNKAATYADKNTLAFTRSTYDRLEVYLPQLEREVSEAQTALAAQTGSTIAKRTAFDKTVMFISHYFQSFNNGILRGMFPVNHRAFYRLDVNDNKIPVIYSETDLQTWAMNIKDGDAQRLAAGGKPMAMPTAAEVETEYQAYFTISQSQSGLKDTYDKEQEDVKGILNEGFLLAKDIWDEVEFNFRHDDHASLRRKAREWGVVYTEDEQAGGGEPLTGTVAPQTSAVIMEGGFDADTLFIISNNGSVPLWFYTAASAGDPVPATPSEVASKVKEIPASELGAAGNTFLMVYNPDENNEGSYEVVVGE
jgi:hypothetical protein